MNVVEIDALSFLCDKDLSDDGVFGRLLESLYDSYKRQEVNNVLINMDNSHKGLIALDFAGNSQEVLPLITSTSGPWLTSYGLQLQKEYGH